MTEAERIESEVDAFLVDRRHLDYIQTDHNHDLIVAWLEREGLEVSAASLHAAYAALHGELDVHRPVMQAAPPPAPAAPVLPVPIPPPQVPAPEAEPERLHSIERLPGESAWMAARRAFAEQQISAQRKARHQMWAEVQSAPPRKTQSREINNQFAAIRKPRGSGAAFIIENGE